MIPLFERRGQKVNILIFRVFDKILRFRAERMSNGCIFHVQLLSEEYQSHIVRFRHSE
jgi:hypothetical protein